MLLTSDWDLRDIDGLQLGTLRIMSHTQVLPCKCCVVCMQNSRNVTNLEERNRNHKMCGEYTRYLLSWCLLLLLLSSVSDYFILMLRDKRRKFLITSFPCCRAYQQGRIDYLCTELHILVVFLSRLLYSVLSFMHCCVVMPRTAHLGNRNTASLSKDLSLRTNWFRLKAYTRQRRPVRSK